MSRDLVERQEIIDRLDRVIEKGLVNILSGEHPITAEVMKEVIMALPSAEPEIIRCSQCKYAEVADKEDTQDGYTCQFHRGSIWFSGSYCSWAERRTDEA